MQLNQYTKALCDETRLRIVMLLVKNKELCVCQLTQVLDLSQPKISRHLAVLRNTGLLQGRKEGQWVHYRFHDDLPQWVFDNLQALYQGAQQQTPFKDDIGLIKNTSGESACN